MNKLIIFTDGACINNGKQNAKAGYGIHFPNNELNDISEHFINSPITNQRAELYAILVALEKIANIRNKNIELYTEKIWNEFEKNTRNHGTPWILICIETEVYMNPGESGVSVMETIQELSS
jgi:ribonuclease HI